jgi:hypothetical protein
MCSIIDKAASKCLRKDTIKMSVLQQVDVMPVTAYTILCYVT